MHNDDGVAAFFYGVLFGILLCITLGGCLVNNTSEPHSKIIEHGAAYYHPETGEFTWKEPVSTGDEK